MTALKEYERLEASGLWRARPDDQRREVIVSVGEASLTISDLREQVLTHWSLATVTRANKGQRPAVYHPDGDPGETLELAADEDAMIDAIERVRSAIERRRPRPGRLRLYISLGLVATVALAAVFWLPGALTRHTLRVLPEVKRVEIADALMTELARVSGPPCLQRNAQRALGAFSQRLTGRPDRVIVVPGGVVGSAHLPDGTILLNRALVEDWEQPEVPAGFVLVELQRMATTDPMEEFLIQAGLWASLRLLTTGALPAEALRRQAERLLTEPGRTVPAAEVLAAFGQAGVSSRPYAYAVDVTGESTLPLIEGDPLAGGSGQPVLADGNWIRLQAICGT